MSTIATGQRSANFVVTSLKGLLHWTQQIISECYEECAVHG